MIDNPCVNGSHLQGKKRNVEFGRNGCNYFIIGGGGGGGVFVGGGVVAVAVAINCN